MGVRKLGGVLTGKLLRVNHGDRKRKLESGRQIYFGPTLKGSHCYSPAAAGRPGCGSTKLTNRAEPMVKKDKCH